eukprot:TRINITY_DN2049_c0_g1_i1.p1 TRINITY_DN2049_c0_g1~~TRINITY_DN2049_c0_g1_i1.p1  ORF type:complete len:125 (+),score=8.89 TRINITY_DN2049_c0_g1_i1:49-423(+)
MSSIPIQTESRDDTNACKIHGISFDVEERILTLPFALGSPIDSKDTLEMSYIKENESGQVILCQEAILGSDGRSGSLKFPLDVFEPKFSYSFCFGLSGSPASLFTVDASFISKAGLHPSSLWIL